MTKPILIWGAGAIGGTLGAAFIRAGKSVVFVDKDAAHVDAINEGGLRIDGPLFQDTVKAEAFLPEDVTGEFDTVFLGVKSQHTLDAVRAIAPHLAANGHVVSAQNGLNERVIAAEIGAERTVGCFVNFDADYMEPGVVHYSGRGAVVVGEIDGKTRPRTEALWALLKLFDADAILTDNVWGYLWGKLIYGSLLYATALTNDSIGDVFATVAHRPILTALAREVASVGKAEKVAILGFDGFDPSAFAPEASKEVADQSFDMMADHNRHSTKSHSGIWRDLAVRKRPTEVDAQLGPILELGKLHGVPTPISEKMISMIHELERGERQMDAHNLVVLAEALVPGAKA